MKISEIAERNMGLYNLIFKDDPFDNCYSENNLATNLCNMGHSYRISFANDLSSAILSTETPLDNNGFRDVLFSDGVYFVDNILGNSSG